MTLFGITLYNWPSIEECRKAVAQNMDPTATPCILTTMARQAGEDLPMKLRVTRAWGPGDEEAPRLLREQEHAFEGLLEHPAITLKVTCVIDTVNNVGLIHRCRPEQPEYVDPWPFLKPSQFKKFTNAIMTRVEELNISPQTIAFLLGAGIEYIWQLIEFKPWGKTPPKRRGERLYIKGFGRKRYDELTEALHQKTLKWGMSLSTYDGYPF